MNKRIEIKNLTIGYQNALIRDISLTINTDHLIAVIGRNGEGKSTLLKTLSGLLPELEGEFLVEERSVFKMKNDEKAKIISIVTTSKLDIGNILVKDFIGFGRYPYSNWLGIKSKQDNTQVNKAIELCNISNLQDRNYNELSDGEKQRVNIARAIAQETDIIILDEPTTHLDLINKIEVLKLLKTLTQQLGKTVIFSSHMLEHVIDIVDEIWLINNSNLISSSPEEMVNNQVFTEVFSNQDVTFDKRSKTFKMI